MIKDEEFTFGSEDEAYWTKIIERTKNEIKTLNEMLKFNNAILEMAQNKLTEVSQD